jgi:hypothetical protein
VREGERDEQDRQRPDQRDEQRGPSLEDRGHDEAHEQEQAGSQAREGERAAAPGEQDDHHREGDREPQQRRAAVVVEKTHGWVALGTSEPPCASPAGTLGTTRIRAPDRHGRRQRVPGVHRALDVALAVARAEPDAQDPARAAHVGPAARRRHRQHLGLLGRAPDLVGQRQRLARPERGEPDDGRRGEHADGDQRRPPGPGRPQRPDRRLPRPKSAHHGVERPRDPHMSPTQGRSAPRPAITGGVR